MKTDLTVRVIDPYDVMGFLSALLPSPQYTLTLRQKVTFS